MRPLRFPLLLLVGLLAGAFPLATRGEGSVNGTAAQGDQQPVVCVPRADEATPPPSLPGPPRPQGEGQEGEGESEPLDLPPVCPEGEVPEVRPLTPVVPKGNPLIGPDQGTPAGEDAATPIARATAGGPRLLAYQPPPCDGVPNPGACYYYASAAYRRQADGGGMVATIERPAYDGSGGAGHTLNEIAVQGGPDDGHIVELGWNVSTDQYGDADPHLFVFHWIGWSPTCYDGCGWQQWSGTYFPGMNLGAVAGRAVYLGYVFWEGNWWAWFDNQWLGYFPGSEWRGDYVQNQLIQWFGEVAGQNGIPPRSDMGNGQFPDGDAAARMSALCDVSAADWVCWYRDQQSLGATVPGYYDIARTGFGQVRYGGPGE